MTRDDTAFSDRFSCWPTKLAGSLSHLLYFLRMTGLRICRNFRGTERPFTSRTGKLLRDLRSRINRVTFIPR